MSLFDVIKYSDVDIYDPIDLARLPKKAVENWRERMIDFAIAKAEEVQHLDKTGFARECLNASKKFRRGEISIVELDEIRDRHYTTSSATACAICDYASSYSFSAAYYAAGCAMSSYFSYSYDAAIVYACLAKDPSLDWDKERSKAKEVLRKILMEDLDKFDM